MKRIGIITLYKDSCNYGGLLQAWALVNVLENIGYDAKQITLQDKNSNRISLYINKIKRRGIKNSITKIIPFCIDLFRRKSDITDVDLQETRRLCKEFRDEIQHTCVICEDELQELNNQFDMFITGSDQVWNPEWMKDAFYLKFSNKRKIAYAASIARYDFTKQEEKRVYNLIKDFAWISVREEQGVEFLEKNFGIHADLVLDPTMLLKKEQWEQEENELIINGDYIFCYFLTSNKNKRVFAHRFARNKGIKLVFPIFVGENVKYNDIGNNEQMVYHVGPREWLYLLHHAKYILTDSFHGTVFSIIYNKQFYHLLREKKARKRTMNSRIASLLKMFSVEQQLCKCSDENPSSEIDYNKVNCILEKKRLDSLEMLQSALEN